ncbi:MAG: molybdopterin-dependent oxidoreductase [Nitrososphaerales archaeon]
MTAQLGSRVEGAKSSFYNGAIAGLVSLGFGFLIRLGGYAPFAPESAIEAFLKIIPASIQEPAVQTLGDFAGQLGLIIATIVTVLVYGLFAVLFEKIFAKRLSVGSLTRTERFLVYSLVPWIFFGLVVFPLTGESFFGVTAPFAYGKMTWLFPISLLLAQAVFALVLQWEYKTSTDPVIRAVLSEKTSIVSAQPNMEIHTPSRRSFIEKGIVGAGALTLLLLSLEQIVPAYLSSGGTGSSFGQGAPVNLAEAPSIFSDARLAPLVDSEVTANDGFYRVAIDLFDPSIDVSSWSLQLTGLVNNPKSYTMSDLVLLPVSEQYNTFECVSNFVNGNLIGNAKWAGFKISDLLNNAGGTGSSSQYVVFYSVDGYSVGIPISKTLMPDSMLAYMMNDAPLPQRHGYPLRAVIPGLYGMMSAKWVTKIEIVDAPYGGYWQTRGWSPSGVVETLAFNMIPQDGGIVSLKQYNGSVILGGVAYAGDRGISKVEVSTDQGKTWQEAQLKPAISNLTWRLWAFDWHPASTGTYFIYSRATDGTGSLQTSNDTGTFPNGATGYAITSVYVNT